MPSALLVAAELMRGQFGVASRRQLLALGLTEGQIEGLVTRGLLSRMATGVYGMPGGGRPVEQAAMIATLRCRFAARITGPLVLAMNGIEGFGAGDPFWVLAPAGRRVENVDFTVLPDPAPGRFSAKLAGVLPGVTVCRAIVESAAAIRPKRLRVGVDDAKWQGLATNRQLRRVAEAFGDHAGAAAVLALLDDGTLDFESEGERAMQLLFDGVEPQPEKQVWVTPAIRVDRLWRDVGMVIEYAGDRHHGSRDDRSRDANRDRILAAHGYHVEHITKEDMRNIAATRARLMLVRNTLAAARGLAAAGAEARFPR